MNNFLNASKVCRSYKRIQEVENDLLTSLLPKLLFNFRAMRQLFPRHQIIDQQLISPAFFFAESRL